MHLVGSITVYTGIIMTILGLVVGFSAMYVNADSSAIQWIGLVPAGFALLMLGTVMTQLSRRK